MWLRRLAVSPLLLLWILSACNPASESLPESVGFSSASLDTLNQEIQQLVDDRKIAGMVTMLARHGTVVQSETFGYQDVEKLIPMQTDTIVRIYSMTKPITGVAMMILHERGLWDLDDPVSKHVPEFAGLEVAEENANGEIRLVPVDHPMTMRELMTHTGGLTYGFGASAVDRLYQQVNVLDRNSSLQSMIDKLSAIPLRQQPGSLWHYSVSVDVQGYIIEQLSGQTLPEFFAEHIFTPLGMDDSGFYVPADKAGRLASRVYDYGPEGELVRSTRERDYSTPPGLPSGGAGLVSTAPDYMRLAQMLLNGGQIDGVRILSAETVELMRADQAPTTQANAAVRLPPGTGFGLDVAVKVNAASAESALREGSYWWAGAAGTWFWIDPVNDLTFVAMAQHDYADITDIVRLTQEWTYRALVDPTL